MVICQQCNKQIRVGIEYVGGCTCDPRYNNYCYCPSKDLVLHVFCDCKKKQWLKLDILSDTYSIERFIQDHLEVDDLLQHYKKDDLKNVKQKPRSTKGF